MSKISDNNKITHKNCGSDTCQKFLKWLLFKFFETIAIFKNYFLKSDYFLKIPLKFDNFLAYIINFNSNLITDKILCPYF